MSLTRVPPEEFEVSEVGSAASFVTEPKTMDFLRGIEEVGLGILTADASS